MQFHYAEGVNDVSFRLFDVDQQTIAAGSTDQIRNIRARFGAGPELAASVTEARANDVAFNGTLNATITGTANAAETSADGNSVISFGSQTLDRVTFTYGSSSGASANPAVQWIALHDIYYNQKVPEVGHGLVAGCVAALGVFCWSRNRRPLAECHS
jgi:hypothetical protein